MISSKKRVPFILIAFALTLSLLLGSTVILANSSSVGFAAEADTTTYAYYYENLTTVNADGETVDYPLAKEFYRALESIDRSDAFKSGQVSYALNSILTSDKIKGWVEDGDLEIPKAFSAARDSFLMDHPELFYVDLYKLTISASRVNGVYSAFIDSGRNANVYRDNSFSTLETVNKAISDYNAALNDIHNKAVEDAAAENGSDRALAVAANEAIAKSVSYDYGAYNEYIANDGAVTASLTHTAYGALVLKKAVCSGFAFAYKAIMDTLDVPCVVVSGYSKGKDSNGNDTANNVGHSWNYVYLRVSDTAAVADDSASSANAGGWFAFDTTWNGVSRDKNKYSVMDMFTAGIDHMADSVISSSDYALKYPTLSTLTYEQLSDPDAILDVVRVGGFEYLSNSEWKMFVSYNGYNAPQLLSNEKLRLVFRQQAMQNGELVWGKWIDMDSYSGFEASGIYHTDTKTASLITPNISYTQFAVVPKDVEPDTYVYSDESFSIWTKNSFYTSDATVESNAVFMSTPIENYSYGTYTPPPYIKTDASNPPAGFHITISDSMSEGGDSSMMSDRYAITFTLVYDEPLHVLDPEQPIKVNFTGETENITKHAAFAPFADGAYVHLLTDANGVANTLQFKFKPSLMYEHDRTGYIFSFENVGSARIVDIKNSDGTFTRTTSDKTPNHAYYLFSRIYMACPKVFGDGRLWVNCCAQPTLVDNSDLSAMNFEDKEGNSTFSEAERSQMMLVVNNVSSDTEKAILDGIDSDSSNNISKDDIQASQTYDIKLSMCGKIASISPGSYVKIALGFPEGYGPDDEGVTFKIFHRKYMGNDNYIIEEIPCVVTKFGIVITCNSFSPYTVVAVPESKATDKTVLATIDGKGGKLSNADGQIKKVEQDGTYTCDIAPQNGYQLYSVTLNGNDVTERVQNNRISLSYDELAANNELEIKFIANEAAVRFEENNIVEPVKVIVPVASDPLNPIDPVDPIDPTTPLSTGAIVGIVIGVIAVVAIAAGVAVAVIMIKKKKSTAN